MVAARCDSNGKRIGTRAGPAERRGGCTGGRRRLGLCVLRPCGRTEGAAHLEGEEREVRAEQGGGGGGEARVAGDGDGPEEQGGGVRGPGGGG